MAGEAVLDVVGTNSFLAPVPNLPSEVDRENLVPDLALTAALVRQTRIAVRDRASEDFIWNAVNVRGV